MTTLKKKKGLILGKYWSCKRLVTCVTFVQCWL